MAWTYSDWITKDDGSTDRLSRLRLHIQEVSDAIQSGDFSVTGFANSKGTIQNYLASLEAKEPIESNKTKRQQGTRVGWTRGRALLR